MLILNPRIRSSLILVFAALMAPSSAKADGPAQKKWRDLSWGEANRAIKSLGAKVSDEAKTTATLTGFIYKDCKDEILFRVEGRNFRIQASNSLMSCLERAEKAHPNVALGDDEVFLRLSDTGSSQKMTGLDAYDGEVRFVALDLAADPATDRYTSFQPELRFVSRLTLAQKEEADRQAKEDARHERLMKVAKQCRDSESNNDAALRAIEELLNAGKLDSDEAETLTKSVGNSELKILEKRLGDLKAEDTVGLENLDDDIRSWQERYTDHEASGPIAARLRMKLAERMIGAPAASSRAARYAKQVYEEIREQSSLPEDLRNSAELSAYDARGSLVSAELSEFIQAQARSGAHPAQIQRSVMEHGAYASYQSAMEEEMRAVCGRFGIFQTMTESGRESFQRCAELRQRASIQQARIAQLLQQELMRAQITQMEIMRQQQAQVQTGQFGSITPASTPLSVPRTEL
jgi:hypothetical protein